MPDIGKSRKSTGNVREELESHLLILVWNPTDDIDYFLFARLAKSLHARGQETVFLPDGRALPWRASLLQKLVMTQRIAADGTAYWVGANDSIEDIRAATEAGLCAIRFATTPTTS